jgi:two-component system response regulator RegA
MIKEDSIKSPTLLLVDDDLVYCQVLSTALKKRGYEVSIAHNVDQGRTLAQKISPQYAIIDLRMPGPSGLSLVKELSVQNNHCRIVVLTGYASISTAVEAIKLGAIHYLAKPVDADEVVTALNKDEGDSNIPVESHPMSVTRLEWEHIQKVLSDCDGNISEAARRLNMHRRTLQRKLKKKPARK